MMQERHVYSRRCAEYERGQDCAFNQKTFYDITTAAWVLTALVCFWKAYRGHSKARTKACWCLGLTGISSMFNAADGFAYLVDVSDHGSRFPWAHHHMLAFLGSIFLVIALACFSWLWCDVAAALGKQGTEDHRDVELTHRLIRFGMLIIAIVHVPIAVVRSLGWTESIDMTTVLLVWTAWNGLAAACLASVFSLMMWFVTYRHLRHGPHAKGLRCLSWINLGEQVLFNIVLILVGCFYFSDDYQRLGAVQAKFFASYFVLYWLMHLQILTFFFAVDVNDPLYCEEGFRGLMESNEPQQKAYDEEEGIEHVVVDVQDMQVVVEGHNQLHHYTSTPAATKIGSPSQGPDQHATPLGQDLVPPLELLAKEATGTSGHETEASGGSNDDQSEGGSSELSPTTIGSPSPHDASPRNTNEMASPQFLAELPVTVLVEDHGCESYDL
jgi:hypothetical protein